MQATVPRRTTDRTASATLVVVCAATLLALMNYTAPMVVVPQLTRALGAGPTAQTWLLNGISVGLAASLLVAGALADEYGRRRVFAAGAGLLAVASVVAAAAPDPAVFVLARVGQGVASAAVVAAGLGLVGHAFAPGPARVRATAQWGAMLGAGIALGPLVSAGLARWEGWRAWYVLATLLAAAVLAASGLLARDPRGERRGGIDVAGGFGFGAGVVLLLVAVTAGRTGWVRAAVLAPLTAAALLLVAFVAIQYRVARPLLEPALFAGAQFRAATLAALFTGIAVIGPMSLVPTLLGRTSGLAPLPLAGVFALWSGVAFLVSLAMRHLGGRLPWRAALLAGFALTGAGYLAMLGELHAWPRLVPGLLVSGTGSGVLNSTLARLAVQSVLPARVAMGSGANNTARYVGSSVGLALAVTLATAGADAVLLAGAGLAAVAVLALGLLPVGSRQEPDTVEVVQPPAGIAHRVPEAAA